MANFPNRTDTFRRLTSRSGLGGLTLLAVSAIIIRESSRMPFGSTSQMGPGYFPSVLGYLLVVFGLVLLVEGWKTPEDRIHIGRLGPPALLLSAIVAFAVLYEMAGAFVAIIVVTAIAMLAERGRSKVEFVILPLGICFGVWLIFGVLLDLQLKFLPQGWLS